MRQRKGAPSFKPDSPERRDDGGSIPLLSRSVSFKELAQNNEGSPRIKFSDDDGHLRARIAAPGTPYDELDLSETFLSTLYHQKEAHRPFWRKRRLTFMVGSLVGLFLGWIFTEGDPLHSLANLDLDSRWEFQSTLQSLVSELPSISGATGGSLLNLTDLIAPTRDWLSKRETSFAVGRDVLARGQTKKHAVVLIPGIISSGLESWSTQPDTAPFFRKRIWASTFMLRAIATSKDSWVKAMSLDPETGLDPPGGIKVRSAQGIDAASSFLPGYWIWSKIVENLAVVDYDYNDLTLAAYDWRLSYYNLEVRDQYFSRLKAVIELNLHRGKKKTVLVSHSMGGPVALYFMKWVEAEGFGNGGPDWVENHISDWVNIAGTMLGVPKAMSALLSGEMKDTLELNPAAVYLLEKFFSRSERAKLFRSWAGSASMMLKGGDAVWGDSSYSPDEPENKTWTPGGNMYFFKHVANLSESEVTADSVSPNLTVGASVPYLLEHASPLYQKMIHENFSLGIEYEEAQLEKNDRIHSTWSNPLEARLPNAPSMGIFCLYGTGKETERAYFYQNAGYEQDDTPNAGPDVVCTDGNCVDGDITKRTPLELPLTRKSWIDTTVSMLTDRPQVRNGVIFGDGDGTVSLLSLGAMCAEGWKQKRYNPGGIRIVTHELKHEPLALDLRGGPTTADHVDVLGSSELNEAVLDIATGHSERVKDVYHSEIRRMSKKIKWEQ